MDDSWMDDLRRYPSQNYPKLKISPENMPSLKRKVVCQPSIFRGELLVLRLLWSVFFLFRNVSRIFRTGSVPESGETTRSFFHTPPKISSSNLKMMLGKMIFLFQGARILRFQPLIFRVFCFYPLKLRSNLTLCWYQLGWVASKTTK